MAKIVRTRIGASVAVMLALGAMAPSAVSAHDSVIAATPEDGGTVEEFPREIVLTFSGIPKDTFNTVAVSDSATNEVLFSQEPELDGQEVSIAVPEDVHPGAGDYTVGFQITSSDGHATRGKTTFSVAGEAKETASAEEQNQDEEPSLSGPLAWIIGGAGVLVLAAVVVLAIARQRRFTKE
ncbi:copper resistance CopC family protein [Corynebacterium lowii]|uniref:CopC domain-containing protein n=1 Tax=Corynebacterium lowii TaxID=1544413 RepID=A0A0Q0UEZ4_9CORY|nr:copper resistance CopC family protein [Corynebacterium lowii]KQB86510.1 hypothetical protein Clow_00711 [Corynebacterium lowii]MDP9851190.1 methionine-rich copper-binding protein CopC [Corynebacterium lowii]